VFSIYYFRKLCSPLKRLGEISPSIRCYLTIHSACKESFFFTFNELFSGLTLFFSAANPQFCWKLYFSNLLYFINQIRIVSDPKIPSEFLSIFQIQILTLLYILFPQNSISNFRFLYVSPLVSAEFFWEFGLNVDSPKSITGPLSRTGVVPGIVTIRAVFVGGGGVPGHPLPHPHTWIFGVLLGGFSVPPPTQDRLPPGGGGAGEGGECWLDPLRGPNRSPSPSSWGSTPPPEATSARRITPPGTGAVDGRRRTPP